MGSLGGLDDFFTETSTLKEYKSATIKEVNLSSLNTAGTIKVNVYHFYGWSASEPSRLYDGKFYIEATCGNQTVKVNNTNYNFTGANVDQTINWTPPISWASQNTTGTNVSVIFKLYVLWGDVSPVYSLENSKTVSIAIPSSLKPSTSMSVSDAMGYLSKYGSYIKSKSKLNIQLTNTLSYNSPIASYNIKANGATYTTNPVTTGVLNTAGTNTITAYVTDKRGRSSSTVSQNITVLDYANPSVNFAVRRCDADGSPNESGLYCQVTYSANVSSLSNKNTKALKLSYKASGESITNDVTLPMTSYSISNQTYIFEALDDKTYTVTMSVTDDFITTTKSAVLSTAFTLMHFNQSGRGLAIGKLSEGDNFDVGIPSKFEQGINGLINCNGVNGIANIVDEVSKDTVDIWKTLGNNVYFFNKTGCLIDQPSQWGFLQNFTTGGAEVHQIWYTQATGTIWHRGGNASGWSGTWRKMYDGSNATDINAYKWGDTLWDMGTDNTTDTWVPVLNNGKLQRRVVPTWIRGTALRDVNGTTYSNWTNHDAEALKIPTMNMFHFWNGAFDSSGNSNLSKFSANPRFINTSAKRGTAPSSDKWSQAFFQGKDGVNYGGIENGYKTSRENRLNMIVYKGTDTSSTGATIGVGFDSSGNPFSETSCRFKVGGALYVGKNTWNDANTGWYLGTDGTAHVTASSGSSINFHWAKNTNTTSYISENKQGELLLYGSGSKIFLGNDKVTYICNDTRISCVNYANNAYRPIYASAFSVQSSKLVKENIENIDDEEAKKILNLRPVSFDYKECFGGEKGQFGLIAEETLDVIPSCVNVPNDYDESNFDEEKGISQDILSIDYSKLVPHLIKMIQIQQEEIEKLKKDVEKLKSKK